MFYSLTIIIFTVEQCYVFLTFIIQPQTPETVKFSYKDYLYQVHNIQFHCILASI